MEVMASAGHGRDLYRLRQASKKKQGEVAHMMGIDQSRISRVEKGELSFGRDELQKYLDALGTKQARQYWDFLSQDWYLTQRPDFWHPARTQLFRADRVLARLDEFVSEHNVAGPLKAQFELHRMSLIRSIQYLQKQEHGIAFVGDIGVGKSTAICVGTGYVLPGDKNDPSNLARKVLLETNTGGATICEVRLKQRSGTQYGVLVQPQSMDEIFAAVGDLCSMLFNREQPKLADNAERGVPEEINRALRNMAGLARTRRKGPDGRFIHLDPAAELAQKFPTVTAFRAEFFERLRLGERTVTELWYDGDPGKTPLEWIKDTFSEINNGRRPGVSLPRRIDVLVPTPILTNSQYTIELIDTKGVDGTAIRPDIEGYIDDPRTLTVLCSRYNSAPDQSIQRLIEHLTERGAGQAILDRGLLLVLAHAREAFGTKDDSGIPVETPEEGYEIKRDQVESKLVEIGAGDLAVTFFNAGMDDPRELTKQLRARLDDMRRTFSEHVHSTEAAVEHLIENYEEERVRAADREVRRQLKIHLRKMVTLPGQRRPPYQALIKAMRAAHPRTVWASARRNGTWGNLDVYHYLGAGAAMDARLRSQNALDGLNVLLGQMLADDNLAAAHEFLVEIRRSNEFWRRDFLSAVTTGSREILRAALYEDSALWDKCADEYGLGAGFRDSVTDQVEAWFQDADRVSVLEDVETRLQVAWVNYVLTPLRKLCGEADSVSSAA